MAVAPPLIPNAGSSVFTYQDAAGNPIGPLLPHETTVLLELYKDNVAQGRHHETQRSTITTICFSFATAFLGLIAKDGTIKHDELWLTLVLVFVSLLGWLLSYKQYERFRLHNERARNFRRALNSANLRLDELKWMADDEHDKEYKLTHGMHLHEIWSVLFLALTALGVSLAWLAWCAK